MRNIPSHMVFFALRKQLTLKSNTCGGVKKKSLNNAPSDLKPTAYFAKNTPNNVARYTSDCTVCGGKSNSSLEV